MYIIFTIPLAVVIFALLGVVVGIEFIANIISKLAIPAMLIVTIPTIINIISKMASNKSDTVKKESIKNLMIITPIYVAILVASAVSYDISNGHLFQLIGTLFGGYCLFGIVCLLTCLPIDSICSSKDLKPGACLLLCTAIEALSFALVYKLPTFIN